MLKAHLKHNLLTGESNVGVGGFESVEGYLYLLSTQLLQRLHEVKVHPSDRVEHFIATIECNGKEQKLDAPPTRQGVAKLFRDLFYSYTDTYMVSIDVKVQENGLLDISVVEKEKMSGKLINKKLKLDFIIHSESKHINFPLRALD